MTGPPATESEQPQEDPDAFVRFGGWLFRHRTALPFPVAAALILIPPTSSSFALPWIGFAIVATGEALRLWAVRQIGVISRTRSGRLGPLVSSGPFGLIRNPLYVGNIALWAGFGLSARIPWLAPLIVVLMAVEYHAIVRWEERLLESRFGDEYYAYIAQVPRWVPRRRQAHGTTRQSAAAHAFSWGETFFSERGTLVAIALGYAVLYMKART